MDYASAKNGLIALGIEVWAPPPAVAAVDCGEVRRQSVCDQQVHALRMQRAYDLLAERFAILHLAWICLVGQRHRTATSWDARCLSASDRFATEPHGQL